MIRLFLAYNRIDDACRMMDIDPDQRLLLIKILTYYACYQCSINSHEYKEIQTLIDKIV